MNLLALLQAIAPNTDKDTLAQYASILPVWMTKYDITEHRQAHFLAQIAHESGGFKHTTENLNYSSKGLRTIFGKYFRTHEMAVRYARKPEKIANLVYADRMGNGNERSGDGWRYRGRGLIQLTGRHNYTACGKALGLDLIANPDQLSQDANASVGAACWFWDQRGLNKHADADDINSITKRINGGYNGLEDRMDKLAAAKLFLSDVTPEKCKFIHRNFVDETTIATVTSSTLNVRSTPSTEHQPIGVVNRGDQFKVLEQHGDWLKIEMTDHE